jgi:hypothetical protein
MQKTNQRSIGSIDLANNSYINFFFEYNNYNATIRIMIMHTHKQQKNTATVVETFEMFHVFYCSHKKRNIES